MKKTIVYLVIFLTLCFASTVLALDIDLDSNDKVDLAYGGTNAGLTDPGGDRLMCWDESANVVKWCAVDGDLSMSVTPSLGIATDGVDNEHINWADIDNLGDEGQLTVGSAVGATIFTDLNDGSTYTNFGEAADDTINELFAAIDDDIGASVGDVTGVGDCADGLCLDGTADGGTYVRLWDGDTHYLEINPGDLTANRVLTARDAAGTLLISGDTLTGMASATFDTDGSTNVTVSQFLLSGNSTINDYITLRFGSAATDWFAHFESADDKLLFHTTADNSVATGDPMFQILADYDTASGTNMLSNQDIFGIGKGTEAAPVFVFVVDEDGDVTVAGNHDVTGASTAASYTTTGSGQMVTCTNADAETQVNAAGEFCVDTDGNFYWYGNSDQQTAVNTDTAQTLTNKTYNISDYKFFDATKDCEAISADTTATKGPWVGWDLDKATDEGVQCNWVIPPDFTGTTLKLTFMLVKDNATASNNVVMYANGCTAAHDETLSCTAGSADDTTIAIGVAQNDAILSSQITLDDITGLAAGELLKLRMLRDADNGSDNFDDDITIVGGYLEYQRNVANNF